MPEQTLDDLLNNLIGSWSLTGKMGEVSLYQEVNAKWVLRELFVEMRFSPIKAGEDGNPDYEALYLIGYDKKNNEYAPHLFGTFGVTSKPVPGIGVRKDNSVRFKFDSTVGPWFNTFTWDPARKSWKNIITYKRKEGGEGTFAEKELTSIR